MATIVTHICDNCKTEVNSKDKLYGIKYLNVFSYLTDGNIELIEKEFCIDCLYKFSVKI